MRYSISQLIARAQAGRIGTRGLHRLSAAGVDPSGLASSGVDPSGVPDVNEALDIRREGNFLRAIQRVQAAQLAGGGPEVGDATLSRLAQRPQGVPGGIEIEHGQVSAPGGVGLSQLLEHYRKRRAGALSNASQYDLG